MSRSLSNESIECDASPDRFLSITTIRGIPILLLEMAGHRSAMMLQTLVLFGTACDFACSVTGHGQPELLDCSLANQEKNSLTGEHETGPARMSADLSPYEWSRRRS